MTLNLRLTGMIQMIGAIRQLNQALQQVNSQFKVAAQNINAAANNIVRASNSVRSNRPFVGPGGGRGGNSASPSSAGFNQQDLGSMAFSGFAGAWNILQAKIWTRVSTGLVNKFLGNHPLNPSSPANQARQSMPTNSMQVWQNFLKGLATKILIFAAIIMAAVVAIKIFIEAVKFSAEKLKEISSLYWSKGGPGASGGLEGIASKLNMSPEEVAGYASSTKGGAKAWLAQVKLLRDLAKTNPEQASYVADNIPGGRKLLEQGLGNMTDKDFNEAMNNNNRKSKFARDNLQEFNRSLGELAKTLRDIGETLSPLLLAAAKFIDIFITPLMKALKWLMENTAWFIKLMNKFREPAEKKLEDAASKFDKAVDKFTDKVGTFGGGERGKNAIPRAWTWQAYTGQLRDLQDAMGAFEF